MANKVLTSAKGIGILLVLVALIVTFSVLSPQFLSVANLFNISRQIATLGIVAVGFTFVLITAGIDLSVGYQLSLYVVVLGTLMSTFQIQWVLAILLTMGLGVIVGLINGAVIAFTKVAPLIITLSMMMVLNGVSYLISGGLPILGFPPEFSLISTGTLLGVPFPLILMVIVWLVGLVVLNKTYFGRNFYAIGSNIEAARLSGVNVKGNQMLVYALCGLFTSVGAVLMLSRLNSAQSATGAGFEFSVLTACVLGGVSVMGGKGNLFGAFVGVLIVGVLSNGLLLLNVSAYVQLVITGLILAAAVIYDTMSKASTDRAKRKQSINPANA
ncbi:ABC transporter permease [Tessaracoccus sp. MC1756]|uniref:ABC transporter permease n=1 Tax=Tessaracoccus sp. MC1756 TaxID=2760311 RepID=UPI001600CF10|nr:ABC transporter permease [Tessaracoccus sp. MC1756]MBB1510880.1 ABC transporter permease [Tessaracoccus sp. MC1756]